MTFHGFEQLGLGNTAGQVELGVQRIEFEKISMGAARGAGPAVSQSAKIICAVPRAVFQDGIGWYLRYNGSVSFRLPKIPNW